MYIRNVTMWIKKDAVHTFSNIYSQSIIPALRETDGCLFAALLQNVKNHQICSSITIWRNKEKAAEYEKGGLFERLLGSLHHLFQDTSDVAGRVWEDMKLDYAPTPERPAVVGFEESVGSGTHAPALPYFVHLLCIEARSEKIGEFRQHFFRNILSLLSPSKGYIDAFLMHRLEQHHSFCVLSFWDGSTDPTAILDASVIDTIRERSRSLMREEEGIAGGGGKPQIFRCLTAEWFTATIQKKPVG